MKREDQTVTQCKQPVKIKKLLQCLRRSFIATFVQKKSCCHFQSPSHGWKHNKNNKQFVNSWSRQLEEENLQKLCTYQCKAGRGGGGGRALGGGLDFFKNSPPTGQSFQSNVTKFPHPGLHIAIKISQGRTQERHNENISKLNSSPIDELGRWCLQSWWSRAML